MSTVAIKKSDSVQVKEAEAIFQKAFHKKLSNDMDVIELSKEGVTKGSLIYFGKCFEFSPENLARLLPITLRTIQRYKTNQKFNPYVSEHIIKLARIIIRGVEVFESRDNFMRWFNAPNLALGGKVPSELVTLQTGAQLVMDELVRIDYGVFA